MKRLYLLDLLALAATLAFAGCGKDDQTSDPAPSEPGLVIEQTDYTLDAVEGRTATVSFTASADWTLTVKYNEDETDSNWLTAEPANGSAGEQTVELSARVHTGVEARTAYVEIACKEQSVQLTVTQTAVSDDTDFTGLFDPEFAKVLQEEEIISDAEHITREDMAKVAEVSELYVYAQSMTSLQGIEYFESLTTLICTMNQLTSLDVSQNTALTGLSCTMNQLTSLDLSKNTKLMGLNCDINPLKSLDLSQNTALTQLTCSENQLESLDLSQNTALTELNCYNNLLESLDLSKNTALTQLSCNNNQLESLDLSQNTALTGLSCSMNQLESLDLSPNTALTMLYCNSNLLTSMDISKNTALNIFICHDKPGDGSTFRVTTWDDLDIPMLFTKDDWVFNGQTISILYQNATGE